MAPVLPHIHAIGTPISYTEGVDWFRTVDWNSFLVPDTPLLEIVIRGTLTYLALFALLRFVMKRRSGTLATTDLLVIVIIADAAQNSMAGSYRTVPDGVALVTVIVLWAYFLDWLTYHVPAIERLLEQSPVELIKNGEVQLENMRKQLVTRNELLSQLREHGIEDVRKVRLAYIEPDGQISVLTHDADAQPVPGPVR